MIYKIDHFSAGNRVQNMKINFSKTACVAASLPVYSDPVASWTNMKNMKNKLPTAVGKT